jgi:uncharacterized protein (TIGR02466 family)
MDSVSDKIELSISDNAKIINLWPTAVLKSNINRPFTFLESQYADIDKHSVRSLSDNLRTKRTDIINDLPLVDIKKFIHDQLTVYKNTIINPKNKLEIYISQSWLSFSKSGDKHHPHYHSNSFLTAVFYFKAEEGIDSISLYNNSYSFNNRHCLHIDNTPTWWTSKMFTVPVKSGDLIIFPSYLDHGVSSVPHCNRIRTSLSMNTWIKGELGIEEALNELILN